MQDSALKLGHIVLQEGTPQTKLLKASPRFSGTFPRYHHHLNHIFNKTREYELCFCLRHTQVSKDNKTKTNKEKNKR